MKQRLTMICILAASITLLIAYTDTTWTGKVVGITDGDTIKVLKGKKVVKIRLYGIDCPERRQPYYKAAKKLTAKLVFRKQVTIKPVSICVCKTDVKKGHVSGHRFYYYCVKLLIERISKIPSQGKINLIFSNRKTMPYGPLKDYLSLLRTGQFAHNYTNWNAINLSNFKTYSAGKRAGLQIADCVASATFNALETNAKGKKDTRFLKALLPVLYKPYGKIIGYGLKFWSSKIPSWIP